jgi:hypothetical protein
MRIILILFISLSLFSCSRSVMKLSVPTVFKEQASSVHVKGARKNKMSFGEFTSSKIERGMHVHSSRSSGDFFPENLLLRHLGASIEESESSERARFRFSLSNGSTALRVLAKERAYSYSIDYNIQKAVLPGIEQLQEYSYIFSAVITSDSLAGSKAWSLIMTNVYNRDRDPEKKLFPLVKPDDNGLASNGEDTIFIKGIALKKVERRDGSMASFPIKMLGGYELSTTDGVVAIVDIIDKNIWFYNELGPRDKLLISTIATAIFARRVKTGW